MRGLYIDRSYETLLGTAFYDRAAELGALARLAGSRRLVIVYGPRNVGKSELLRYFLHRRYRGGIVVSVDARLLRARRLEERAGALRVIGGGRPGVAGAARILGEGLLELLASRFGVVDLLLRVKRLLEEARARIGPVLLFVDEFHELPGYSRGDYEDALSDLRSLAGLLSKSNHHIRVLVTVSEGFAATGTALSLLEGYSADWLLVEHLDREHFAALLEEYRAVSTCSHSLEEIYGLVGGAPGVLPDLCALTREDIVDRRIAAWLGIMEQALSTARNRLEAQGIEVGPRELVREALRVLEEPVKPLTDYKRGLLAEILVVMNIAYPKRGAREVRYLPQYPVYKIILEEAVRGGVNSLLELDPAAVYRRAVSRYFN